MLINGIELNTLGIQLYDRILYSNNIDTKQEWLDGDIQPTFIRQQDRFKTIKLDFLVLCSDEDEAFKRISKLTALLKKSIIKFDDLNFVFETSIIEVGEPTRLKNGNFIVSYTLSSGYAKGQREIYTTNANMTNAFKLTVVYYKDATNMLATETVTIRASAFDKLDLGLEDLGIDVNKHQPKYYNNGIATNLMGFDLTYENLQTLQALIINYSPIAYNVDVVYYMDNGEGFYNEMLNRQVSFTQPQLANFQTIGQLLGVQTYRPVGYRGKVLYDKGLTVEEILGNAPYSVFYDKVETPKTKNVIVAYKKENDEGEYETFESVIINVNEENFYDGSVLKDFIAVEGYRPNPTYYNNGYIDKHSLTELVSFDTIETSYSVIYTKATNTVYVEYYAGVYPNWYRLTTAILQTKYKQSYENEFNVLTDLGIDLNKYHSAPYNEGSLYNGDIYTTYDAVINAGVLQVYYTAIDYPISVHYYTVDLNTEPVVETVNINALMFFGNPILADIIPIAAHRPEGYQFDEDFSYDGEITLEALTQASPIKIVYEEISAARTKNIIIRYKQELASAYSTITTNLITISEADIVGGTRLRDIINLNAYQPEFYEAGIIDGASSTAIIQYDEIASAYDVLYVASTYLTPVRYYVDKVEDLSWIGSSTISYRIIDFTTSSTLYDFGLNLNMFKPAYTSDGELLYTGPVNFSALLETESINVLYTTIEKPEDDEGIDYPHRFLFLQHNDLGDYEHLHPEWTMNHAFINTGVSVDDMSKLTVVMECERVDENVPLYQVNAGYGYLFGSYSSLGAFYMRYQNQTLYGENLSGVNLYEAKAGAKSNVLTLAESTAIGFGENSGIYSSAQQGYSRAIFTYSHLLATDGASMPYPLYLFANNFNGSYSNGLAGIGIYGCRIYYNDQLIRDFIPVQYYDKIGDKIAPSNCLYDKITKTFFEDGTGLNSFNIRDDDRYTDTNLQHKIGHCYVNYYKGNDFIKTIAIYFRGDEFDPGEFDLYDRFFVDENQPQYCKSGEIKNFNSIEVSFNGLNNQVFEVHYEPIEAIINVNYYREDDNGNRVLLSAEEIALEEKDFYSVPSFGDLVRLNKYKPEGYETDFVYPGSKVSLSRVVENSPYNIVYKPIKGEIKNYTTIIQYIKKVFGVRQYETIGTEILTLNQSDFRDGEYIDFWINKNKMKPEKYYKDGMTYQWYEMDERLNSPEDLKESYTIAYMPEKQYLEVNYYTDEVDEENLIASSTWGLQIDELDPNFTYSIIEILPNEYINKYKPVNCGGGLVQDATTPHTFESLVEIGVINIVYETLVEPDDPTEAYYENKVIGFGSFRNGLIDLNDPYHSLLAMGGCIPYIDLGYRPKELGRLRVEIRAVAQANGLVTNEVVTGGWQDTSYVDYFGYRVPKDPASLGNINSSGQDEIIEEDLGNFYSSAISNRLKGHFSISTRVPVASGWVYSAEGPQYLDGQTFYTADSGAGVIAGNPQWIYYGQDATFRRGVKFVLDENWEPIECYREYGYKENLPISSNWVVNPERFFTEREIIHAMANPITTILDAYNGYWSSYTEEDSNHASYDVFENKDLDIFEARLQPKGTLSLFRTTNPLTGDVNIMAHYLTTRQGLTGGFPMALHNSYNPYTGDYKEVTYEVLVQTGTDSNGNAIFEKKMQHKNVKYCEYPVPVFPQLQACAIWSVKVWDRDRLVRDLIPVAKDDKIYDYIMPENGMFDLVTEIFFGNSNKGGTYTLNTYFENENKGDGQAQLLPGTKTITIKPEDVLPLWVCLDPTQYGKITMNYYNYDYSFINNQFVSIPTWYSSTNTTFEEIVGFNDYKPNDFYLDGFLDIDDPDSPLHERFDLYEIYKLGSANVWYKLKTFTKTVVYYQGNTRIGSRDLMYSLEDIQNAKTLADLGIDIDLYWTEDFAHGEVVFDENIIASDDIQAFIDAPSPIVIYRKLTKEEAPDLFYVEYYRGGASDETLIVPDPDNENYFDCDLDGVILNPNGAIKYYNHYHSALYEDEVFDYFIPYQVKVLNKYIGIHRGPARKFPTLATIVENPVLTIIEERNGWGRLKEYPVGWIMLSATEPMTGPGQNPDYDVPDETTATIPFATEVHINKMTVDRLWCYIPEVESWVKAEDISFNQSGKLYNGLGIEVIHLNQLDFTTITDLNGVGIYPNSKALYFHDKLNYQYDGEYTYEAFSNLHEIEFIYPETIYNYRCLYYKDSVADNIKAGDVLVEGYYEAKRGVTGGNDYYDIKRYFYAEPDASSNNYSTYIRDGKIYIIGEKVMGPNSKGEQVEWYPVRNAHPAYEKPSYIYEGYMMVSSLENTDRKVQDVVIATEDVTTYLGSASFSCSIGDWNPDWDVFIATSWKVDENGNEIAPDLYRDTELSLTWDYFGFDKNLYRPDGSPEGIYLWNPRTWENEGDIHFTFQELVRMGTQYVLYPCVQPDIYKILVNRNVVEHLFIDNMYNPDVHRDYYNPGINLDLRFDEVDNFYTHSSRAEQKLVDYVVEFEMKKDQYTSLVGENNCSVYSSYFRLATHSPNGYEYQPGYEFESKNYFPGIGEQYSIMVNMSNFRKSPSAVYGIANVYEGKPYDYYIYKDTKNVNIPIDYNTNLEGYNRIDDQDDTTTNISLSKRSLGILYGAQSYQNFLMKHWWVPVPKGLWYKFNGVDLRVPDNGMLDILTNRFEHDYRMIDGQFYEYSSTSGGSLYYYTLQQKADGESYIFKRNQIPVIGEHFDYFETWTYESTDVDYIVQVNNTTPTFQQPDLYSIGNRTLAQGLVLPISRVTSDANNRVVGEWYFSGDQWFESKNSQIHAGTFDKTKLTKLQQNICIVKPNPTQTYYVYLDPSTVTTPGEASDTSYGSGIVKPVYYNYIGADNQKYYFDGAYWIPEKYTAFNTQELNKNYAIVPDTMPYYSDPIEESDYIIGQYHYGERITVPYVATQDTEWGYTGLGWIRLNSSTVSEIL